MARRRPSDYRPPVRVGEFVQAPEAEEDERIDVGVCFVGGGPAGLAGALRLAQLLEADPATAEKLGDTPIAVLDKGRGRRRAPALRRRRQPVRAARPAARRGDRVAARLLRRGAQGVGLHHAQGLGGADPHAAALPQQGQLRLLAEPAGPAPGRAGRGDGRDGAARDRRAEAAGARPVGGRRAHRRQGARPRRPAARLVRARRRGARADDGAVARATQGHLAGALFERFRVQRRDAAGVEPRGQGGLAGRPSARPRRPHAGLAVPAGRQVEGAGRQLHLPDGRGHAASAWSVGLDTLDASLSVHDPLQQFKTHP